MKRYTTDELENELIDMIQELDGCREVLTTDPFGVGNVAEFVQRCLKEGMEQGRACFREMGLDYQGGS